MIPMKHASVSTAFIFLLNLTVPGLLCVHSHAFCSDFNDAADQISKAGIGDPFRCQQDYHLILPSHSTYDGVCNTPFNLKPLQSIQVSLLSWSDVVIMSIYSNARRNNILFWWLQFFEPSPNTFLDFVIFANHCQMASSSAGSVASPNNQSSGCDDDASELVLELKQKFPFVRAHIVRGLEWDSNKHRVACKMLTGMIKTYNLFPQKKYFFQIDDDTVVFPKRLMKLLKTIDAAVDQSNPLYIGTVLNDHKPFALCGNIAGHDLCYAQGGAGYVLNNVALGVFNRTVPNWPCTAHVELERQDGDAYIAFRLHKEFQLFSNFAQNVTLLNCGVFRPNSGQTDSHYRYAVTFHHADDQWISYQNVSSLEVLYGETLKSHV